MAKRKGKRKRGQPSQPKPTEAVAAAATVRPITSSDQLAAKPLAVAKGFSAVLLLVGLVMLVLGAGVLTGRITEGWGFPMSAVPNWGRPWGAVLIIAALAYVAFPILLFVRAEKGLVAMMIVCGLSVLVGTPLITTTTEILYNLLTQHDCQADWTLCRPNWIDSVWGYFMVVNIGVLVGTYKAITPQTQSADSGSDR